MAFSHARMTRQTLVAQEFGTQKTMTYIGLAAVTLYARSIGEEYTDVVEQGCLAQEILVGTQFGVSLSNSQGHIRNAVAMGQQDMLERWVVGVILMYEVFYHVIFNVSTACDHG